MNTRYIPHIIYTLAITSISTHLLWHRKESDDQRRHVSAHIALLESTVARLRAGDRLPDDELDRVLRFGEKSLSQEEMERARAVARGLVRTEGEKESIGWKEALLGSRKAGRTEVEAKYEKIDMENVRKEMEQSTPQS
ncbi:hypothetical protein EUX98_g9128 [Antrodiella citrinella]|uniref:Uncharacterized protein n=1 Tax=Antrodiella citrinella TaxID=2447956 RepID=A0A4S4LZL9_9APHY|nr:hypothetical protein EUX98_g9128 [Antrodiella citrinella]